jgi:bifunctional UDP-N-acetylglucosamine pyrophosphorylase/glucosamine-1-phosphate N-acetyltransferase
VSIALIVPAAGTGSRLGSSRPKLLAPVDGRPMVDHLAALYRDRVARWFIVCRPADESAIREHGERLALDVELTHQASPTGMLDAILVPRDDIRRLAPDLVWVTWCDQIAIHPLTVARLESTATVSPRPALVFPTSLRPSPYIHLERDAARRITAVRHRREGDQMPEMGESDAGLFSLTREAYVDLLPGYAAESRAHGHETRERNFLPFIPWLQSRGRIETFPCVEPMESVGVNTPEELAEVERYLRKRGPRRPPS